MIFRHGDGFDPPAASPLARANRAPTIAKTPAFSRPPRGLGRGRVCSIDRRRSTNLTERVRTPSWKGTTTPRISPSRAASLLAPSQPFSLLRDHPHIFFLPSCFTLQPFFPLSPRLPPRDRVLRPALPIFPGPPPATSITEKRKGKSTADFSEASPRGRRKGAYGEIEASSPPSRSSGILISSRRNFHPMLREFVRGRNDALRSRN